MVFTSKSSSLHECLLRVVRGLFAVLVFFAVAQANAADIEAGRNLALKSCAICHGKNGLSTLPMAPNLAGQIQMYTEEQIKLYRSGKRANEVMAVIAKSLTDTEIADLAAWYASIVIEVKSQ